jgi:hypothetical protein
LSFERVLDSLESVEEILRRKICFEEAGTVEKRWLIDRTADRLRFAEVACLEHVDPRHKPQQLDGTFQKIAAGAEVRAASDEAACHALLRPWAAQ